MESRNILCLTRLPRFSKGSGGAGCLWQPLVPILKKRLQARPYNMTSLRALGLFTDSSSIKISSLTGLPEITVRLEVTIVPGNLPGEERVVHMGAVVADVVRNQISL